LAPSGASQRGPAPFKSHPLKHLGMTPRYLETLELDKVDVVANTEKQNGN
jgi:hypothetical protein